MIRSRFLYPGLIWIFHVVLGSFQMILMTGLSFGTKLGYFLSIPRYLFFYSAILLNSPQQLEQTPIYHFIFWLIDKIRPFLQLHSSAYWTFYSITLRSLFDGRLEILRGSYVVVFSSWAWVNFHKMIPCQKLTFFDLIFSLNILPVFLSSPSLPPILSVQWSDNLILEWTSHLTIFEASLNSNCNYLRWLSILWEYFCVAFALQVPKYWVKWRGIYLWLNLGVAIIFFPATGQMSFIFDFTYIYIISYSSNEWMTKF